MIDIEYYAYVILISRTLDSFSFKGLFMLQRVIDKKSKITIFQYKF